MTSPKRGDLWWAENGGKRRPVLVISADAMNRRLPKVIVIPGTSNLRGWPDELRLAKNPLPSETAFCCREITTMFASDLVDRAGQVPEAWLDEACNVLASVLGCPPPS
jgi:mRNA-degrading endonuclease toxin of MazEF toxin-antitoxin module